MPLGQHQRSEPTVVMLTFFVFFFFFQAEDGIRDKLVTGVQTCALPIFPTVRDNVLVATGATGGLGAVAGAILAPGDEVLQLAPHWPLITGKIGRASCRERV